MQGFINLKKTKVKRLEGLINLPRLLTHHIMVTKSDKDSQALKLLNNRKRIQNLFLDFNIISSI